jgi:hypothetical protein
MFYVYINFYANIIHIEQTMTDFYSVNYFTFLSLLIN